MKKTKNKSKKIKNPNKKTPVVRKKRISDSNFKAPREKQDRLKPVQNYRKKTPEKKRAKARSVIGYIDKARQFLRESKMELKKVKWPTKKELLASTAVVLFLTLLMALYFGIVDFRLLKIIKTVMR